MVYYQSIYISYIDIHIFTNTSMYQYKHMIKLRGIQSPGGKYKQNKLYILC